MARPAAKKDSGKNDDFAKVLMFIRHVRNLHVLGPNPIRAEAVDAETALERALGKDMEKVYKTRTWKNG